MKWMSDVVRVEEEERKGAYSVLMGKPKGWDHLEDPGVGGRIMLE